MKVVFSWIWHREACDGMSKYVTLFDVTVVIALCLWCLVMLLLRFQYLNCHSEPLLCGQWSEQFQIIWQKSPHSFTSHSECITQQIKMSYQKFAIAEKKRESKKQKKKKMQKTNNGRPTSTHNKMWMVEAEAASCFCFWRTRFSFHIQRVEWIISWSSQIDAIWIMNTG